MVRAAAKPEFFANRQRLFRRGGDVNIALARGYESPYPRFLSMGFI